MKILRKYQLDIIFLYFANLIIVGVSFFIFKELKADPHDYEWFIVGPLLLLYVAYVWEIRSKVDIQDRRKLTGKTLAYWIAFGILLFANYYTFSDFKIK